MVRATIKRNGDNVSLTFPFDAPTPAAVFRRADTVWLVFDTDAVDRGRGAEFRTGQDHPQRDRVAAAQLRNRAHQARSAASAQCCSRGRELDRHHRQRGGRAEPTAGVQPQRGRSVALKHHHSDRRGPQPAPHRRPDAGDTLYVATALAPARGFLKTQDFVEFRALASFHGVALHAIADDINVELAADKIILSRPSGLTLSGAANSGTRATYQRHVLDPQSWGFDRQANFTDRNAQLIMAAADAPETKRLAARCDLARFYLARDMYPEAKAVLDVALADNPPSAEDPTPAVLRAVANIMIGRADAALKDLSNPFVGNQYDAPLWRALALARLGKWAEAREGFRESEASLATLPLEMQRVMLKDAIRAFIEVGDVTGAVGQLNEFEMVGVPRELEPAISVLSGRVAEGLGRIDDALRNYRAATDLIGPAGGGAGAVARDPSAARARQPQAC